MTASLREISRKELRKLVSKMKGGKASGEDGIDRYSLKLAAPLMEDALLHIVHLSTRTSCWKHQLIFPLHNKSDKDEAKNYRPVSHLVEVGKLLPQSLFLKTIVNIFIQAVSAVSEIKK